MAFRWAREADPEAVLLYNDYDNEVANRRSDAIYQMIAQMQQESAPIDGVGMQMHLLNPDSPYQTPHNKADVVATMRRFGRLGMQVHVTEFDVFLAGQPGTQQEKWAFQAAVYRDMLGACLESGVCRSFSVYGLSDAVSWYLAGHANPEPLLFDADYEPKPAYWSVRGVLSRNPSP
jgi:endo-1,4-beta-xylanase